MNNYEVNIKY